MNLDVVNHNFKVQFCIIAACRETTKRIYIYIYHLPYQTYDKIVIHGLPANVFQAGSTCSFAPLS